MRALEGVQKELREIRNDLAKIETGEKNPWKTLKEAADYLRMSPNTFETYLYKKSPAPKGHKLDGKTLFHVKDLDTWAKLYGPANGL